MSIVKKLGAEKKESDVLIVLKGYFSKGGKIVDLWEDIGSIHWYARLYVVNRAELSVIPFSKLYTALLSEEDLDIALSVVAAICNQEDGFSTLLSYYDEFTKEVRIEIAERARKEDEYKSIFGLLLEREKDADVRCCILDQF